jgi:hypothetical protein
MSVPFRQEKLVELVKKLDGYVQLEKHSYPAVEIMVALGLLYIRAVSCCACNENSIHAMFDEIRQQAIDEWRCKNGIA